MNEKKELWSSKRYKESGRNTLQEKNALETLETLDKFSPPENESIRILDIGCGVGNITAAIATRYPNATVIGLDESDSMLSAAMASYPADKSPNLSFVRSNIADYTPDEKFDYIVSFNCLHWMPELDEVIKNSVASLLNENGNFCFMLYPRVPALWNAVDETARDDSWAEYFPAYQSPYYDYNSSNLTTMLGGAGFDDIQILETEKVQRYENGTVGLKEYIWGFLPILNSLEVNDEEGSVDEEATREKQSAFLDEVMEKYVSYEPLDADGACLLKYLQLDVSAKGLEYVQTTTPSI